MRDQGLSFSQQTEAKKNLSLTFLVDKPASAFSDAPIFKACPTKANLDSDPNICNNSELGGMGLSFIERSRQGQKEPDVRVCT